MLTLALAATLVGFVLLVLGLITGTVWLAIACIVVCLVGLGLLIADIVGSGRRNEEPSISDFVAADDDSLPVGNEDAGGRHEGASGARTTRSTPTESRSGIATDAPQRAPDAPAGDAGGARSAPRPSEPDQGDPVPRAGREGTYDDYLRSVGGYGGEPGVSAPRPQDQTPPTSRRGPGSYERQFPPPGRGAPGTHAAPDDPATESFPPQQRRPSAPGGPQQRTSGQQSEGWEAAGQDRQRQRESRTQKFDPLDPNWRPPPE